MLLDMNVIAVTAIIAVALLAITTTGAVSELMARKPLVRPAPGRPATRPNVLLVGIDGVRHGRHELLQPVWMHGGPPFE